MYIELFSERLPTFQTIWNGCGRYNMRTLSWFSLCEWTLRQKARRSKISDFYFFFLLKFSFSRKASFITAIH